MFTSSRLSGLLRSAERVPLNDDSKFVFFSDCHRGDNSWADDFANNQNLFAHALYMYNRDGFTYFELGDGDELWENLRFEEIKRAHRNIFELMSAFHKNNRLYLIWGNHNRKWKNSAKVEKHLSHYYDERDRQTKELFKGIKAHEGLVLHHSGTGKEILLAHGHQGDLLNDYLWWVGRFIVRILWKPLQLIGFRDPTSPARNFRKKEKVEKQITHWVLKGNHIICGHTHRSVFPDEGKAPYFNTGSCVHPRCITGIEIEKAEIKLIKWWIKAKDDGTLAAAKEELEPPRKLQDIFEAKQ